MWPRAIKLYSDGVILKKFPRRCFNSSGIKWFRISELSNTNGVDQMYRICSLCDSVSSSWRIVSDLIYFELPLRHLELDKLKTDACMQY